MIETNVNTASGGPQAGARHLHQAAVLAAPPNYSATVRMTRLSELETVIKSGMQTFVEVGSALMEIRDKRLYREMGFTRFDDYCYTRWNWSRRHANRQIQAAKIAAVAGPRGPKNEKQARELAGLESEEIEQVVKKIDLSTATAKDVRRVVQKIRPTMITATAAASALKESDPELYQQLRQGKRPKRRGFRKDKTAPFVVNTGRGKVVAEAQKRRMIEGISLASGEARGLAGLDILMIAAVCDSKEIMAWSFKAQEIGKSFRDFARELLKAQVTAQQVLA